MITFWLYKPAEPRLTFGQPPASLVELAPRGLDQPIDTLPVETSSETPAAAPPSVEIRTPAPPPPPQDLVEVTRVEPPRFRKYTVQRGDVSWFKIAERTLGDRKRAGDISRANPFVSPDRLIAGRTELLIPIDGNIDGKLVTELVPRDEAAKHGHAPADTPPAAATTYIVADGDTLSSIARRFYGDPAKWSDLFIANRDVIDNPDRLKTGTPLKILGSKQKH
ncbi:MAG: LysM peptidoglycan-binding domain-containing protein [Phycisphaerales bacterium]|nr:LysM peptidoglycan-binding domain-containing protein [Phycisphaerales bacterium]